MRTGLLVVLALLAAGALVAEQCTAGAVRTETYRDALGFDLPPGSRPERIVSLSPNLTEILFAIGVNRGRIVGITRFCDYPADVEGIDRIGGIVDPSVEKIVSLRPDLVLATRGNPSAVLERMRAAGLHVFAFESQGGLDLLFDTMQLMIRILGPDRASEADSVLGALRSQMDCLRAISETIPESERQSVYYYDPVSPGWTAGPGTHVSEAIALAGGRNVAADAPVAWPRYALETLLVRQPDVLLIAAAGLETDRVRGELATLQGRPGWRGLRAVRDSSVCFVPADWLMRPGPRVLGAVEILGRCLHPERRWQCAR